MSNSEDTPQTPRNEDTPQWPAFPVRLMALPAVNDAVGFATHLYQRSKEYRLVGMALGVAEGSLKTAVTIATPLATPLLGYVDHLKPLDHWACRRLDDVERMAPVVTKPSEEVLSATREGVLRTLAGGDDPPPPSLCAAVSSRTARIAEVIKEKATAAGSVPHRVLDSAHDLLDQYLTEEEKDASEPDIREGGLGEKTVALASKTTNRVCRSVHNRIHPECTSEPFPSHVAMGCVEVVRSKWSEKSEEVKQAKRSQMVQAFMFVLRVTVCGINLMLVTTVFLVRQVNAVLIRKKCCEKRKAPPSQDQPKPHDN